MALFKTVYSSSAQELGADGLGLASLPAEPVGGLFEKRGGFGRCCERAPPSTPSGRAFGTPARGQPFPVLEEECGLPELAGDASPPFAQTPKQGSPKQGVGASPRQAPLEAWSPARGRGWEMCVLNLPGSPSARERRYPY